MAQVNPYAAPKAAIEDAVSTEPELATLWQRFAGSFVDNLVVGLAGFIGALASPAFMQSNPRLAWLGFAVPIGAVLALQFWLLTRYRATIGKRAMKTRMVRAAGGEADLWRLILLRGLPQWILSVIPVANLLLLVDALFIFGKSRRCVHDYLAGTIVVKAA
jgi:uncharacterized RDD family membrane protein YckC